MGLQPEYDEMMRWALVRVWVKGGVVGYPKGWEYSYPAFGTMIHQFEP